MALFPKPSTTRVTTPKVVVTLTRYCAAVGAIRFILNPGTLPLQGRQVEGFVSSCMFYINTIIVHMYTAYLTLVQGLIFSGHVSSGSVASNDLHLQFGLVMFIQSGLNLFLYAHEEELLAVLNDSGRKSKTGKDCDCKIR